MIIVISLLSIGLLISIGIGIASYILIKRLLNKIVVYENWILTTRNKVEAALEVMREIDKQGVFASSVSPKGIFESDDLVGQIFKQLLEILDDLNKKIQE